MTPVPELFVHKPENRPTIHLAGDRYTLLASGAETGGAYAAFEALVPPGGGPPPHVHHREDEMFCVLEGEITFFTGDRELAATSGTWVHAPRDIPHRFQNRSAQPARMLIMTMPAGIEEYFWRVGAPVVDRDAPILPPTHDEIERLIALAPEYGLEILVP